MKKCDIVYVLKTDFVNNELRYSLRSLENFPHDKVWFVGGQPNELQPDGRLAIKQYGDTKWERVKNMLGRISVAEDISEDFWLFNDDFFILKPWTLGEAVYNGTLSEHIEHIERRHRGVTPYTEQLRACEHELNEHRCGTLNYAVHCPILLNKEKVIETLRAFPNNPMFRSLYGNYQNIKGIKHEDCKIVGMNTTIPDNADFVSTEDGAFDYGAVGAQIRSMFPNKCRYEEGYEEEHE